MSKRSTRIRIAAINGINIVENVQPMKFNTPMTVAQLEATANKARVDIHWENNRRPSSDTMVEVDDEKYGIWSSPDLVFLGQCIVW